MARSVDTDPVRAPAEPIGSPLADDQLAELAPGRIVDLDETGVAAFLAGILDVEPRVRIGRASLRLAELELGKAEKDLADSRGIGREATLLADRPALALAL